MTNTQRPSINHRSAWSTHIGLTHRVNQDRGAVWTGTCADGLPVSLAVVADGVSAGAHSERVSNLVVERVMGSIPAALSASGGELGPTAALAMKVLQAASTEVAHSASSDADSSDATTVALALCAGTEAVALWAGDSRVYLLQGGRATLVTRDHSWLEEVVAAGLMSSYKAQRDPRSRMITRWLGPPDRADIGVESVTFSLVLPATVLCCSDGLYLYFERDPDALAEISRPTQTVEQSVCDLVDTALSRGGHDDITAAAIRVS